MNMHICEKEMTHESEQVCRLQHDMNSLLGIILHDETFDLDNVLRTLNAVSEARVKFMYIKMNKKQQRRLPTHNESATQSTPMLSM